jgi:hydrogenase expression/formation protein HypC
MCLGVPMVVVESDDFSALCERGEEKRRVSLMLVGPQAPGTRLLVHIDSAIRALDEEEARQIDEALRGLEAALHGEDFDSHFADLIGREPQLPDHLR